MMRSVRAFLAALVVCAPTIAWGQAILQGGPWTPGHAPQYVGQGSGQPIAQDSGPAGGGGVGVGLSELGITARGTGTPPYAGQGTGPLGTNVCDYDAPITNAGGYHFLCLSPNVGGNAVIAVGSGGGATPGAFIVNLNGVNYPFPGSASVALTIGTTTIAGGTNGSVEYNNAGFLGEIPVATINTPGTLVQRDGSGNFSAGIVTANESNITAGAISVDGQASLLSATQPASPVSTFNAVHWRVTSSGAAAQPNRGMRFDYLSGYTGNQLTAVISAANAAAGTANLLIPPNGSISYSGNVGVTSSATATTTGLNIGAAGHASGGAVDVGLLGLAQIATNNATNIGVVGTAVNTGTAPVQVGGWFTTNQTTVPTASAALIADNGSQNNPVFLGQVNGATKVIIAANGFVGAGTESNPQAPLVLSTNAQAGLTWPSGTLVGEAATDGTAAVHSFLTSTNTTGNNTSVNGSFVFQTSNGTVVSPSALGSGSNIGVIGFEAHNGSAFPTPRARIIGVTTEVQSGTNEGTGLQFDTTAAGGTARAQAARIMAGVIVGNTSVDPGAGNLLVNGQVISGAGTPTIASGACGATTNGAVVAGSTNQSGQITIGAATTTTCTISWSATLSSAPKSCVFFPMNATAAATGTTVAYASAPTTTQVVLNGSALANANYAYLCL